MVLVDTGLICQLCLGQASPMAVCSQVVARSSVVITMTQPGFIVYDLSRNTLFLLVLIQSCLSCVSKGLHQRITEILEIRVCVK